MKPFATELYANLIEEKSRELLYQLRSIILQVSNELQEVTKYGIPFFTVKDKWVVYITFSKKYKVVEIGFPMAHKLPHYEHQLIVDNRKLIRSLRMNTMEEINEELIKNVILETILLIKNEFQS